MVLSGTNDLKSVLLTINHNIDHRGSTETKIVPGGGMRDPNL